MGQDTRPVQRWEILRAAGITITLGGKGVVVEMTVDGAARLVQSLQSREARKGSVDPAHLFLEEIMQVGKLARRKLAQS